MIIIEKSIKAWRIPCLFFFLFKKNFNRQGHVSFYPEVFDVRTISSKKPLLSFSLITSQTLLKHIPFISSICQWHFNGMHMSASNPSKFFGVETVPLQIQSLQN